MKKAISLILAALLLVVAEADKDSQCYLCYAEDIASKYCMLGMDSPSGKCCLPGSTEDCSKEQYYCSDKISNAFSYQKYAFCSFDKKLCGTEKRTLFAKFVQQRVYTGLDFALYDICPYYIYSHTDLPFNTQVQLTMNSVVNADAYLLVGSSVDKVYI